MNIEIVNVEYGNSIHAEHLLTLLNAYAIDPAGGADALTEFTKKNLINELAKRPDAFSLLCYVDGKPAGFSNFFETFSTFACKPIINIHDLAVLPNYRKLGIATALLSRIEEIAKQRGCCKLTLEVLEGNQAAKSAYKKFGFGAYELDPAMGEAVFWQKNW